jgi:hypothetical protein
MMKRFENVLAVSVGMIAAAVVVSYALRGVPSRAARKPLPLPRALVLSPALVQVRNPTLVARHRQAREHAVKWLDQADRDAQQAVTAQVATIATLFEEAKQRTPALANEVLAWSGHWRFLIDHVPGAGTGRHRAFLDAAIARHLFRPEQLTARLDAAVRAHLQAEHAIEDQLLVQLRQDLADLAEPGGGPVLDTMAVTAALDRLTQAAAAQACVGLQVDVSRELLSWMACEVVASVAVRAVLPEGLMASTPATLGVGLAAAVVVDQAIAWTWDYCADPRGALAKALNHQLDECAQRVLAGTREAPGLQPRLEAWARERAAQRRGVILDALDAKGGPK